MDATLRELGPDLTASMLARMVWGQSTTAEVVERATEWQLRVVGRLLDTIMRRLVEQVYGVECETLECWRQHEPRLAAIVDATRLDDRDGILKAAHRINVIHREMFVDLVNLVLTSFPEDPCTRTPTA